MVNTTKKALVLFSGGQDSTVCLAWALENFDHVETLAFDYGQRHAVELICRRAILEKMPSLFPKWKDKLQRDHLLSLPALAAMSETALTRDAEISFNAQGLPSTFVPARNLLFLTYAAALGYRRGINDLVGGMCETDYSGYPDCRRKTIESLQESLRLGLEQPITLHTPLMALDKAATWHLSEKLGGAALQKLIIEETHSCYLGVRDSLYPWGHGCGTCPACTLRRAGFEKYKTESVL